MDNQSWPKIRSLKDDPPPLNSVVLIFNGKEWNKTIPLTIFYLQNYHANGYTHWLPMPPDPPQPKQAWEEAWGEWFGINAITNPPTSSEAFKAGWNAAVELFDKEWKIDTDGLPSELSKKLKAP